MPTATLEEYLEAIYKLGRLGPVRPSAIAEAMGVSPPTITATLRRLADRDLVDRPGGAVELTAAGEREALSILRRHRLAERFLVDTLGMPWDDVHEDACMLEHALSPRVQDALARFLGEPTECPHGHPIPDVDLHMPRTKDRPLRECHPGERVRIAAVGERDPEALKAVAVLGLLPGSEIVVTGPGTGSGEMAIEFEGVAIVLEREVASCLEVVDSMGAPHG